MRGNINSSDGEVVSSRSLSPGSTAGSGGGGGRGVELSLKDGLLFDPNSLDVELCSFDDGDLSTESDIRDDRPGDQASYGPPGKDPRCVESLYGVGGSGEEGQGALADMIGPDENGGLVWTAKLVGKDAVIKPRRGMPFPVRTGDFLSSVVMLGRPSVERQAEAGYDELWERDSRRLNYKGGGEVEEEARWVFRGVMNGWPGLTLLEVRAVYARDRGGIAARISSVFSPKSSVAGPRIIWDTIRGNNAKDLAKTILKHQKEGREILVEMRAPSWTSQGWSERSPGFVFWVEGPTIDDPAPPAPRLSLTYGTDLIRRFSPSGRASGGDPICERVHMINHRYAKLEETAKDRLTYHSFVLLEWDHGKYCTIVEIGWLNGIGGYKGKSNWFHDRDDESYTQLYAALPPELVLPWKSKLSEIRATDVPYRSREDFTSDYMRGYEGREGRFLDVSCSFSHEARLTYRSRSNIATYLLNYIRRDRTYSEMRRNCQTFAADLCGFLAGKRNVSPYHPVNQIQYANSTHYFLYESSKYKKRK